MNELAKSDALPIDPWRLRAVRVAFGDDGRWLSAMSVFTLVELVWWAIAWGLDIAPALRVGGYILLAFGCLGFAAIVRQAIGLSPSGARWPDAVAAAFLTGVGASAFLPLKYAIPNEVPFWLDKPLAVAEQHLFGAHPWLLLDRLLGWTAVPMDWLYGSWLPMQSLVFFLVVLAAPSTAKSRALIAYSACWFLLGVVAAALLSSAGPIFYDRLYGGHLFGGLRETLQHRGVLVAIAESDRMWFALARNSPGPVSGISAVPSIHVSISLWIYLAARTLAPRAALPALLYFVLVWVGSVQLGWHYVTDGLVGALGMLAIWRAAALFETFGKAGNSAPATHIGEAALTGCGASR